MSWLVNFNSKLYKKHNFVQLLKLDTKLYELFINKLIYNIKLYLKAKPIFVAKNLENL